METFEFLNVLQVHGFPKVMGVLTHLDQFTEAKKLRQVKKALKACRPHPLRERALSQLLTRAMASAPLLD